MRVARGMFRLWLVLSCLWIAAVASIGYSNWPTAQQAYVPEFMKDDASDHYAQYLRGEDTSAHNWWDKFADLGSSAISGAQGGHASTVQQSARQLAVATAELALIPPALIFIVGIGLTWALRGF